MSEMRDLLPFWDEIKRTRVALEVDGRVADRLFARRTVEYRVTPVSPADDRDEEAASRMDDEGGPNPHPAKSVEAPVSNGGNLW